MSALGVYGFTGRVRKMYLVSKFGLPNISVLAKKILSVVEPVLVETCGT